MTLWKQGASAIRCSRSGFGSFVESGGADRAGLPSGDMTRGERFGPLRAPAARAGRSRAREAINRHELRGNEPFLDPPASDIGGVLPIGTALVTEFCSASHSRDHDSSWPSWA
jgi:hypothetical protein